MSILWREGHSHGCWEPVQMLLSSRLLQDQEKVCLHFLFQAIGFVLWVDALILKWASIFSCIFLGFFFLFSFSLYINFHWISMEVSELFSVLKNIIWNSHLNSLIFGLFFWVLPDLHDGVRDLTWVWFWIAKSQFFWLILFLYFLCEILQIRGWRWLMKRKEMKGFLLFYCAKNGQFSILFLETETDQCHGSSFILSNFNIL